MVIHKTEYSLVASNAKSAAKVKIPIISISLTNALATLEVAFAPDTRYSI